MDAEILELLSVGNWVQVEALAGSHPRDAVRSLMKVLLEQPPFDHAAVRIALGEIRDDQGVRAFNTVWLSLIAATGEQAVHPLITALQDRRWWVFEQAALALARLGSAAGPAVPGLLDALREQDRHLRALDCIAAVGPVAAECAGRVGAFLHDADPITRSYAVRTLGALGSPEALALLNEASPLEEDPEIAAEIRSIVNERPK